MRLDEEYVKNAVVALLNNEFKDIIVSEGDDPPDYNLQCDGNKYYLEVTQCKPLINSDHGSTNTETYNSSIARTVDELNNKYGPSIDPNLCISLHIRYPISNYNQFRKNLDSTVKELIDDNLEIGQAVYRDVSGEQVKFIKFEKSCGKKISVMIEAKSGRHEINIDFLVQDMLVKAIEQKTTKLDMLDRTGVSEIWLGLLNDYFLADNSNYENVLPNIQIPSVIDRIFIIDPNGSSTYSYSNPHSNSQNEVS